MDILVEAEDILTRWAEVATAAWQEDRDIAAALDEAFAPDLAGLDDEAREIMDTLNGVHSKAAGFQRWLAKRETTRGGKVKRTAGRVSHGGGRNTKKKNK